MVYIVTELDKVNRNLWQILGQNESWLSEPAKRSNLQKRLLSFHHSHSDDPDHIDNVIKVLSRGFYLTKSALEWHEPAIGHNSNVGLNHTHKARGIQWQLVMAYGGFDLVAKALMNDTNKGSQLQMLINFSEKCNLPPYDSLNSPKTDLKSLDKWLTKPATSKDKEALLDFLNVDKGDLKIIKQWMIESQPISTWAEAARLAKALRNASAHGALSASKVNSWGLRKAMQTLSHNLGEFVVAGLQKLT